MNNKVYQIVTDKFIEALETGVIPWQKPWKEIGGIPANAVSGRRYHGVNPFLLLLVSQMKGYTQPYWLTYNQAKNAGGNVKKGEKSAPIVYWNLTYYDKETGDKLSKKEGQSRPADEVKTVPYLRYFNVFNIEQCEDLDEDKINRIEIELNDIPPIDAAEAIVRNMPNAPKIEHNGGNRAYYHPRKDEIQLPERGRFNSPEEYYGTKFHEMIHSTGHKSRLDRELQPSKMNKESYSKEELIAELGRSFLNAEAGILEDQFDNSAAYIENWLQVFKDEDNARLIVNAAANAQKAADYILNR